MQREKITMTPEEAAQIMREESFDMIQMSELLDKVGYNQFNSAELKFWLCAVLLQFAEFKWSMADIIEAAPLNLEKHSTHQYKVRRFNLDAPPFEADFFNKEH